MFSLYFLFTLYWPVRSQPVYVINERVFTSWPWLQLIGLSTTIAFVSTQLDIFNNRSLALIILFNICLLTVTWLKVLLLFNSNNSAVIILINRCPWCNGYRRRNWTRRHEFKSWTDCISHSTNTLGKGMNPIILPPAMGK